MYMRPPCQSFVLLTARLATSCRFAYFQNFSDDLVWHTATLFQPTRFCLVPQFFQDHSIAQGLVSSGTTGHFFLRTTTTAVNSKQIQAGTLI